MSYRAGRSYQNLHIFARRGHAFSLQRASARKSAQFICKLYVSLFHPYILANFHRCGADSGERCLPLYLQGKRELLVVRGGRGRAAGTDVYGRCCAVLRRLYAVLPRADPPEGSAQCAGASTRSRRSTARRPACARAAAAPCTSRRSRAACSARTASSAVASRWPPAQRWRTHRRRSLVLIPHGKRCYGYEEPALPLRRSLRFCPKACKIQYENERPPHVGALHSIASFCRYACIGFVMQFFRNHMENNIDESADRPGVLFDTFLTTAVQLAD